MAKKRKVGNTDMTQEPVFEQADLDAIKDARATLVELDAEPDVTLARWIVVAKHLRRSTDYADRMCNGERGKRFTEMRTAWLKEAGFLDHRILKVKQYRYIILRFADHADDLTNYWNGLYDWERHRLRHPCSIWNQYARWRQAQDGIGANYQAMEAWWKEHDTFGDATDEDPEPETLDDEGQEILSLNSEEEADLYSDDEPAGPWHRRPAPPFEEAIKHNAVDIWENYSRMLTREERKKETARRAAETRRENKEREERAAKEEAEQAAREAAERAAAKQKDKADEHDDDEQPAGDEAGAGNGSDIDAAATDVKARAEAAREAADDLLDTVMEGADEWVGYAFDVEAMVGAQHLLQKALRLLTKAIDDEEERSKQDTAEEVAPVA
jgi:hypothetical protein